MARPRRIRIVGLPQHVIHRGNNKSDIFRCTDDYEVFLWSLHQASVRHHMDVHTYVLMSNHVHILATPRTPTAISDAMQAVGRWYVPYFNRRYGRTGTLFEGRHKALLVDTERYWFTCMRYVELNPVRAGMVSGPDSYRWSSYHAHALGVEDRLVVPHQMYLSLGSSPAERQECWRRICGEVMDEDELSEIRAAVNRGGALGVIREPSKRDDES